eukprot:7601109-Pyramimonas_sp.AAC.1
MKPIRARSTIARGPKGFFKLGKRGNVSDVPRSPVQVTHLVSADGFEEVRGHHCCQFLGSEMLQPVVARLYDGRQQFIVRPKDGWQHLVLPMSFFPRLPRA